jgi:hypothetical protein
MKLAGGQLMQPDELEALRCRKDKNAMVKSPKSRWCKGRCCKVDTIKVKGLPGGGLLFIGCLSLPFLTYFFQKKMVSTIWSTIHPELYLSFQKYNLVEIHQIMLHIHASCRTP